jgi:ankyrin repeat protein
MEDDFSSRPTVVQRFRKPITALAFILIAGMALAVPVRNLRQQSLDRALFEVYRDDGRRVAELLQQGADINAHYKSRLLHPTWVDGVRMKLGRGSFYCGNAIIEQRQIDGGTPLLIAISRSFKSTASYLVRHGADVNRASDNGATPLMLAVHQGDDDLRRLLIEHGAK